MVLLVSKALELKQVKEINLIRVSYCGLTSYFHFNSCLKQLYIGNKMECFSYQDGVMYVGICILKHLKKSKLGYRQMT